MRDRGRGALVAIATFASACLSVPSGGSSVDAAGGGGDGGGGGDAAAGTTDAGGPSDATPDATTGCRRELAIDMGPVSEMSSWSIDDGADCDIANNGTLLITHEGSPSLCRRYQLDTFDLADNAIRVTMSPSVGALQVGFAAVLPGAPEDPIDARSHLVIERDETALEFNKCDVVSCSSLGVLTYDANDHTTWQLSHDSTAGVVRASAIGNDGIERLIGTHAVDADTVRCVGLAFSSVEQISTGLEAATFDDLIAP